MTGLVPDAFGHDPSATAVFEALPDLSPKNKPKRDLRAVVIGGGTGAPVSIRTLLSMGIETSAVVAMADDGGSTGILRDQAGVTAPGDIRKCLTAMALDSKDPFTQAFKVRFGFAENHTLGNLMLSALEATTDSFPQAIEVCEELLKVRGRVYPSTLERVSLVAKTQDGRTLLGQTIASHSRCALARVALESDREIVAYKPACEAIRKADMIVLGPGSLFTSIIPNLIVPGIIDAIKKSSAQIVFVCSIVDVQGETRNMSVLEHFKALETHGMKGLVDAIITQRVFPQDLEDVEDAPRILLVSDDEIESLEKAGVEVLMGDFVERDHPTWHDPAQLRSAFKEIADKCHLTMK